MRKNKQKLRVFLLILILLCFVGINAYGHSGRTDANGGHRDNQNKSGLGSYHYHCGGNPPHLHTNGACPYSSSSSSSKSSSSKSSNSSSSSTKKINNTVKATGIEINENIESIEVGEIKTLTATITPENVTDKNITWKSSDESIATVSSTGELIAKKAGTVEITVATSNGKTSTIKINIEELKEENTIIMKTSTMNNNDISNNATANNQEDSNPLAGVTTLGLLGGGSYWGYNKYKKLKS